MPAFTDNFTSLAAWTLESGDPPGHFSISATESFEGTTSGKVAVDDVSAWAYSRLDLVDGGVPATVYWVAYAVFIPDWAPFWNGGSPGTTLLPALTQSNDPDVQAGYGSGPTITATSSSTGYVRSFWDFVFASPHTSLTAGVWHTLRYGLALNGASSYVEFWVDDVLIGSGTFNSGLTTGLYGLLTSDDQLQIPAGAIFYVDAMTWSPAVDPGEPIPGGNGGGGASDCTITVSLDDVDFSGCALEGSVTRRLNRPALATIKIPMDCADGCSGPGARLKISFDGTLFFHGMVMDWELDGDEDFGYITMNASDPMELWQWRPVRDATGNFSNPTLIQDDTFGGLIVADMLQNTEGSSTAQGNPFLNPPSDAEGPTFLNFSSFSSGGADLSGAPVDWPMSMAELASLLMSTGELDIVITPTDPGGGIMGDVDTYTGNYGSDLSTSVVFQYGTGAHNVRAMRWNQDMSTICNKLWYYGGPRVDTAADPAGDEHWCWNVTGDDADLYGNLNNQFGALSGGPFANAGPGGALPTSASYIAPGQLGVNRADSQDTAGPSGSGYGVRMEVRIYDAASDACLGPGAQPVERWLYRHLWQAESWLRCYPRTLVHVTPIRGFPLGTFDIGDLVGVEAGSQMCGGFSGAQRVYEYTISWTEDGPCELSELQTSSDAGIATPQ